jgi:hypothetical protein
MPQTLRRVLAAAELLLQTQPAPMRQQQQQLGEAELTA